MLKFGKSVPYLLDPARPHPRVTPLDQARAAAQPPQAVPFHCKPWGDGQRVGWTLFYGYLTDVTISVSAADVLAVENLPMLARETNQPRIIHQFAPDHFGIGSGYTLKTPPGFVSLLLPATDPPPGLEMITGVIESDWYPRQTFLVFRLPQPDQPVHLTRGAPLARVVVIPRQDNLTAQPLSAAEMEDLAQVEQQYLAEAEDTASRWTAANGAQFTHLYRIWSALHRHDIAAK
ncbi:MAG: hypothetical protein KC418_09020 [Anaerolineales bacterium]|nr:hypothetical protein [Anaerolineales bacterium]MCB8954233.1 hypothetical protein [Ardenticatenales bacterium]